MTSHDPEDGPSELQKRYGSDLPPSLRWGAVQPQDLHNKRSNSKGPSRRGMVQRNIPLNSRSNSQGRSQSPRAGPSSDVRKTHRRRRASEIESREDPDRTSRPDAFLDSSNRGFLLLRDTPEYTDYPGAKHGWYDESDGGNIPAPLPWTRSADRRKVQFALDAFPRPARSSSENGRVAARAFFNRTQVGTNRRNFATVEDVEDESDNPTLPGAEDESTQGDEDVYEVGQRPVSSVPQFEEPVSSSSDKTDSEGAPTEQSGDPEPPPEAAVEDDGQAPRNESDKSLFQWIQDERIRLEKLSTGQEGAEHREDPNQVFVRRYHEEPDIEYRPMQLQQDQALSQKIHREKAKLKQLKYDLEEAERVGDRGAAWNLEHYLIPVTESRIVRLEQYALLLVEIHDQRARLDAMKNDQEKAARMRDLQVARHLKYFAIPDLELRIAELEQRRLEVMRQHSGRDSWRQSSRTAPAHQQDDNGRRHSPNSTKRATRRASSANDLPRQDFHKKDVKDVPSPSFTSSVTSSSTEASVVVARGIRGFGRGNTRVPKHLVRSEAIEARGYPFDEEQDFFVLSVPLDKQQIDELIHISKYYKGYKGERGMSVNTRELSSEAGPKHAEQRFQAKMRERLRNLGYAEKTIDIMVDEEKAEAFKENVERRQTSMFAPPPPLPPQTEERQPSRFAPPPPVYPRIHKKHIEPATLKYYDIPWQHDYSDPDFITILCDIDPRESQLLFEHTRRIREGRLLKSHSAQPIASNQVSHNRYDNLEPKSEHAYYRRRNEVTQDLNEVGLLYKSNVDDTASSETSLRIPWFRKWRKDESHVDNSTTTTSRLQAFLLSAMTAAPSNRAPSTKSSLSRSQYSAPQNTLMGVPHATYGDILQKDGVNPPKLMMVPKANASYGKALFHLRHFHHITMNFDNFKSEVLKIPELQNMQQNVRKHLEDAQRSYEKVPHHGNSMCYMKEFCHASSVDHDQVGVVIACVPFYDLRPHGLQTEPRLRFSTTLQRLWHRLFKRDPPDIPGLDASGHPFRTLFQSLNPRNNRRRDLKQIVCQMLPHRDQYLHLSQVWFVVINNDMIITCSTLTENELYGDLLHQPTANNLHPPKREVLNIHLKTPDNHIWLLEQDDCATYLDLAAHFCSYTTNFADDFVVLEGDAEISPHEWPLAVERSRKATLYLVLKAKEHGNDWTCEESPATTALYTALSDKWFTEGVPRSSNDNNDSASTHTGESQFTIGEAAQAKVVDLDVLRQMQDLSGFVQYGTGAIPVYSHEKYPKKARSAGNKDNSSETDNTYLPSPLTRKDIQISTLKALAIIQREGTPTSQERSEASNTRLFLDISRLSSSADIFDEYLLYDTLKGLTIPTYNDVLTQWCSSVEPPKTYAKTKSSEKLDLNDIGELSEALGCQFDSEHSIATGEETQTLHLDGWLYANVLSGVRGLLIIYLPEATDNELEKECKKLLTATITLVKALDETLTTSRHESCFIALRQLNQAFRRLFSIAREFELYSITSNTLRGVQRCTPQESQQTLKHIVLALTLAAKAIADLGDLLPDVKNELARRKTSFTATGKSDGRTYAYSKVKECCNTVTKLLSTRERPHDAPARQKEKDTLREKFDEGVERLEKLGWQRAAARSVLYNEYAWSRVQYHADLAWQHLLSGFKALLNANSSDQIQWKAAAFPIDLLALVLPQVLWRPVLDNQDAVAMYNKYVTDLESNILTGDPSREPLDRIRNLRHELNAISQLQRQQIDVLEKLVDIVCSTDSDTTEDKHLSPHPRLPVFKALPKGVRMQNDNIRELNGMLDVLQTEATAQVSGVQDWRDNATVVFTTITIIFLPLSFIASVFGMNTSDVRNMQLNQWVFWASAAPFTLLVILITVYFVDVPPLWRWLERKGSHHASQVSAKMNESFRGPEGNSRTEFLASVARQNQALAMYEVLGGLDRENGDGESTVVGGDD